MRKYNWKIRLGILLMVVSAPVFISLLIIPFLNVDNTDKVKITTIVLIVAEVLFWSGGLLAGKELFNKYKSYLNPMQWFKKKQE